MKQFNTYKLSTEEFLSEEPTERETIKNLAAVFDTGSLTWNVIAEFETKKPFKVTEQKDHELGGGQVEIKSIPRAFVHQEIKKFAIKSCEYMHTYYPELYESDSSMLLINEHIKDELVFLERENQLTYKILLEQINVLFKNYSKQERKRLLKTLGDLLETKPYHTKWNLSCENLKLDYD